MVVAVVAVEAAWEEVVAVDLAVIDLLTVMVDVEMTATEGIAFSQSIIRMLSVAVQCACVRACVCMWNDSLTT